MNMAISGSAFLEVDGVKAAASLNFDYKNKLWGYNSGVSRDHMEFSPGWVLLGHTSSGAVRTDATNSISCAATRNTSIALAG
jgi:hypothetical protein